MGAEQEHRMLNRLQAGAGTYACGGYLAGLGSLQRSEICTALLFSRLERKMRMVEALRRSGGELEPDLLPALLPHAGRPSESGSLPHAGAARILQNRSARTAAPHAVESLLFGRRDCWRSIRTTPTRSTSPQFRISGGQIRHRTDAGRSLAAGRHTPGQPPRLRLAQAAEFFAQDEFVMERAMACRTEEEIRRLFCVEASDYWRTHHIPESQATTGPSVWGLSRPTSSASTSSRCCNSPTAATPDAKPCATAP
ncbi:MAG: DUF2851 family protein [Alistipes finegoldii]